MADLNLTTTTDTAEQVMQALTGKAPKETPDQEVSGTADKDDAATKTDDGDAAAKKVADDDATKKVADATGDGDEGDDGETRKARQERFQKRIDRLKWEQHQKDSEIERLRAENVLLRAPRTQDAQTKPTFAEAKPKIDNFDTVEAYIDAMSEWTEKKVRFDVKTETDADRQRVEASQHARESDTVLARHAARIEDFRKTHADFDAVAQQAMEDNLPMSPLMVAHVQHSDLGPDLLYHLAKNPDECKRIASLPAGPGLVALGELQGELKRSKSTTSSGDQSGRNVADGAASKRHTPPPPPVKPVGGASTTTSKPLDEMTMDEYKAARRRQLSGR